MPKGLVLALLVAAPACAGRPYRVPAGRPRVVATAAPVPEVRAVDDRGSAAAILAAINRGRLERGLRPIEGLAALDPIAAALAAEVSAKRPRELDGAEIRRRLIDAPIDPAWRTGRALAVSGRTPEGIVARLLAEPDSIGLDPAVTAGAVGALRRDTRDGPRLVAFLLLLAPRSEARP